MELEYDDVFISYAHADNRIPIGRQEGYGFVSLLRSYVETWVGQLYTRDVKVSFDGDFASGTLWKEEIYSKLANCRVFLPIVSPRWQESKWTRREWNALWQRVKEDEGLGNDTRIIPISYNLDDKSEFRMPSQSGEESESRLRAETQSLKFKRRFYIVQDDFDKQAYGLAKDIADRLIRLDKLNERNESRVGRPKVFLGIAFADYMKDYRDKMRNELTSREYDISEVHLDDLSSSWTLQGIKSVIERRSLGCGLAFHFLDLERGPQITDSNLSILQIQCSVVQSAGLAELFWLGEGRKPERIQDTQYREFVRRCEWRNDSPDEIKLDLRKKLKELEQPKALRRSQRTPEVPPAIWMICESGDSDVVKEIREFFAKKGWPLYTPGLDVEQKSVSTSYDQVFHKQKYFFFYWGKGGPEWGPNNLTQFKDARLIPSGGINPPGAALIYHGLERASYKENYWGPGQIEMLQARKYDRFDPEAPEVKAFIARVEGTWRSSSAEN